MSQSTALAICEISIRQEDGLFSLNDLHKASGGEARHRPAYFLSNEQTRELTEEISKAGNPAVKTLSGRYGGTYACRELVIAYAAWISAAFHLKVIRVFLQATQPQQPRIDARALLLDGQSDRTVTLPDHIQAALNARAGVLAGEAFTLIHEHLRRRVAFRAVNGDDELCRDDVVLNLIAEGDLGDALAHEYVTKVRHLLSYFNEVANVACRSRDQVGDHLKALRTTH